MIRLSMLQLRVQAITAAVALIAFAVLLAATGPHLASLYAASGIRGCQPASCGHLASNFLQQLYAAGTYWVLYLLGVVIILLAAAVFGLFWGAPLIARELETGTSALAWTQSVTRTRWLAVKLAVVGLAAIAVTEGLSLMQAWWAAPIGRAVGHGASSGGSIFSMNQFSTLVFGNVGNRRVLAALQCAQVGNNSPAIGDENVRPVSHHRVFAVGDCVENFAVRHFADAFILKRNHRGETVFFGDAVAQSRCTVAHHASDVETLLPALHQFACHLQWNTCSPVIAHFAGVVVISADTETRIWV